LCRLSLVAFNIQNFSDGIYLKYFFSTFSQWVSFSFVDIILHEILSIPEARYVLFIWYLRFYFSVHDEGYSRNVSCALILMYTFFFWLCCLSITMYVWMDVCYPIVSMRTIFYDTTTPNYNIFFCSTCRIFFYSNLKSDLQYVIYIVNVAFGGI
jgi:hypothetical protein